LWFFFLIFFSFFSYFCKFYEQNLNFEFCKKIAYLHTMLDICLRSTSFIAIFHYVLGYYTKLLYMKFINIRRFSLSWRAFFNALWLTNPGNPGCWLADDFALIKLPRASIRIRRSAWRLYRLPLSLRHCDETNRLFLWSRVGGGIDGSNRTLLRLVLKMLSTNNKYYFVQQLEVEVHASK